MSAIELLHQALPPRDLPDAYQQATCCVLGTQEPCIPRHHAIKPSFTNLDLLRAPDSEWVSVRAWRVLTHSVPAAEGKKRDTFPLMQSSWYCSPNGLNLLNRLDVRNLVLAASDIGSMRLAEPWAAYVTTSYKKHGCLRAPMNRNGSQRWLFELDIVDCTDREKVAEWWERLSSTREAGIPRPCIEVLDIGMGLFGKHLKLWTDFERWARSRWQSPLFRFLVYLLPSEDELRAQRGEVT